MNNIWNYVAGRTAGMTSVLLSAYMENENWMYHYWSNTTEEQQQEFARSVMDEIEAYEEMLAGEGEMEGEEEEAAEEGAEGEEEGEEEAAEE